MLAPQLSPQPRQLLQRPVHRGTAESVERRAVPGRLPQFPPHHRQRHAADTDAEPLQGRRREPGLRRADAIPDLRWPGDRLAPGGVGQGVVRVMCVYWRGVTRGRGRAQKRADARDCAGWRWGRYCRSQTFNSDGNCLLLRWFELCAQTPEAAKKTSHASSVHDGGTLFVFRRDRWCRCLRKNHRISHHGR